MPSEEQTIAAATKETPTQPVDGTIAGHDCSFYWQLTRWVVLGTVVAVAAWELWQGYSYIRWIIIGAVVAVFTYALGRRPQLSRAAMVTAASVVGVVAGLGVAIFEIAWHREWLYALNIIRLPVIVGGGAAVVSVVIATVHALVLNRNQRPEAPKPNPYGGIKQ